MTVAQLKRAMDRRFIGTDRRFVSIDRRFRQVDRRFAQVDRRFAKIERRLDRVERGLTSVRAEIVRSAKETRRHFDVVVESLHDDLRIFADGIAAQSARLNNHEKRITRLEGRVTSPE